MAAAWLVSLLLRPVRALVGPPPAAPVRMPASPWSAASDDRASDLPVTSPRGLPVTFVVVAVIAEVLVAVGVHRVFAGWTEVASPAHAHAAHPTHTGGEPVLGWAIAVATSLLVGAGVAAWRRATVSALGALALATIALAPPVREAAGTSHLAMMLHLEFCLVLLPWWLARGSVASANGWIARTVVGGAGVVAILLWVHASSFHGQVQADGAVGLLLTSVILVCGTLLWTAVRDAARWPVGRRWIPWVPYEVGAVLGVSMLVGGSSDDRLAGLVMLGGCFVAVLLSRPRPRSPRRTWLLSGDSV